MNTPRFRPESESAGGAGATSDFSGAGAMVATGGGVDGRAQPEPIASFAIGAGMGMDEAVPARQRMSSSSALLLGAVLVAGAAMVGMRKLGIGPGAAMGRVQFDTKLVDTPPLAMADHTVLLADLNASRVALQVPDDAVKHNPFVIAHVLPEQAAAVDDSDALAAARAAADRQKQSAAQRRQALADALKGLSLNSILEGATPIARLSGKAVCVGDRVAGLFIVRAIKGRTVELEHEGTVYILELNRGGYTTADPAPAPMSLPPSSMPQPFHQ